MMNFAFKNDEFAFKLMSTNQVDLGGEETKEVSVDTFLEHAAHGGQDEEART